MSLSIPLENKRYLSNDVNINGIAQGLCYVIVDKDTYQIVPFVRELHSSILVKSITITTTDENTIKEIKIN